MLMHCSDSEAARELLMVSMRKVFTPGEGACAADRDCTDATSAPVRYCWVTIRLSRAALRPRAPA